MNCKFKPGDKVRIKKLSEPLRTETSVTVTEISEWQGCPLISVRLYRGRNLGEITIAESEIELIENN